MGDQSSPGDCQINTIEGGGGDRRNISNILTCFNVTPKSLIPPFPPPLPFLLSQVINNDLCLNRNNHSHNKDFFSVFYFYAGSSFHLLFSSGYTENFTFQ